MTIAGAVLLSSVSCSKFLDELPDNRAELDTADKIYKLLVSAYADRTYVRMCELASDNVDDQGEDNPDFSRLLYQNAYWDDMIDAENESNQNTWQQYYNAIGNANTALEAIENLGTPEELLPAKGPQLQAFSLVAVTGPRNPLQDDMDIFLYHCHRILSIYHFRCGFANVFRKDGIWKGKSLRLCCGRWHA